MTRSGRLGRDGLLFSGPGVPCRAPTPWLSGDRANGTPNFGPPREGWPSLFVRRLAGRPFRAHSGQVHSELLLPPTLGPSREGRAESGVERNIPGLVVRPWP